MKKIVIIFRIGYLGDTIVSMPAIINICENKKANSKVLLLTQDDASLVSIKSIMEKTDIVDDVLVYKNIKQLIHILTELRSSSGVKIDFVYLMPYRTIYQKVRDYILFKSCLRPSKIYGIYGYGKNKLEWERLYEISYKYTGHNVVISDLYMRVYKYTEVINFEPDNIYIALGIGTNMPAKQWPVNYYSELVSRLINKNKYKIVLFGDANDIKLSRQLKEINNSVIDLCGKVNIYESLYLLSKCDIYVGNDTGAMHLAGFAGVKCICIFSSRDKANKWDPIGRDHVIHRKRIDCEYCMKVECPYDNECIKRVSVDEVYDSIMQQKL